MAQLRSPLPATAINFDSMPDSGQINMQGLRALLGGISRSTIYRWIAKGTLPPPRKLGSNNNFWCVGDIRSYLVDQPVKPHRNGQ